MLKISRKLCIVLTVISVALLLIIEMLRPAPFTDKSLNDSFFSILTRFIGAALFFILIIYLGYDILKPKYAVRRSALFALPCLIVAVNNLPYFALIFGNAYVDGTDPEILFFALECLLVASFEEFAFRGVLFYTLMQKCDSRKKLFKAIIISSVVFGLFHLVNLIYSQNIAAVFLQVGYSALIGAMCAYVLIKTGSIWICVIVHAVYNFCGQIVPRLGGGVMLNVPQIIITVIIAIFCTIYIVISLLKSEIPAASAPHK